MRYDCKPFCYPVCTKTFYFYSYGIKLLIYISFFSVKKCIKYQMQTRVSWMENKNFQHHSHYCSVMYKIRFVILKTWVHEVLKSIICFVNQTFKDSWRGGCNKVLTLLKHMLFVLMVYSSMQKLAVFPVKIYLIKFEFTICLGVNNIHAADQPLDLVWSYNDE